MDPLASRQAWLRLGLAPEVGASLAARLVEALGGVERAARPPDARLRTLLGTTRAAAVRDALRRCRPQPILRRARALGQEVLTPADAGFPGALLAGLVDCPAVLFLRGQVPSPDTLRVAVVGTRDASPYGLRMGADLASDLARAGAWVISGLALGIDAAAHEAALAAGGRTLGVLGCGLDVPYPAAHAHLKERMVQAGGLLSEHPPGTEPRPWHFPRRNRLVAALAEAVVVVEAPERSGALITAHLALDLGREVLAVPGPAGRRNHAGTHRLLRQGAAALCEDARDVFAQLGRDNPQAPRRAPDPTGTEGVLWRLLDDVEALDANELCTRAGLDPAEVAAALTGLELAGRVRRVPGLGFTRL